jgi:nucleotide-binding universal stress UspA family protein
VEAIRQIISAQSGPENEQGGLQMEEKERGRRIVFAVDGTTSCEEGLKWLSRQIARKGDTVHLAHVICDPRTPSTAVGSSAAATQWSPQRDEQSYAKEFLGRVEKEANDMLESRFVPPLFFSGIGCEKKLLRLRVHKSAGGIGETLSNYAMDIGADLLVIASHGAGVYADYGSVARWCSENSPIPTMLLPPAVLNAETNQFSAANSVVVAAADDMKGLKTSFDYALTDLTSPGDGVFVIHAVSGKTEEEMIEARKSIAAEVMKWQEESPASHAMTLNVAVQLITSAASDMEQLTVASITQEDELEPDFSPAAVELCDMIQQLNSRTMVLAHHGHSVMREMVYKPLTLHCMRHCPRPLIVLSPTKDAFGY